MTAIELLRAARELLDDEARWLRGDPEHDTVNAGGGSCPSWSDEAVRWDVYGALCREATSSEDAPAVEDALRALAHAIHGAGADPDRAFLAVTTWHDKPNRAHAEVLGALDRAIEHAGRPAEEGP